MSGPDTLRGIDYQITTSALRVLTALAQDGNALREVTFDSLDDEGEDLTLVFSDDTRHQIQIKKRSEGYLWTEQGVRNIIAHFLNTSRNGSEFIFITDAPGNPDVRRFKEGDIDAIKIQKLVSEHHTESSVRELLRRTTLHTRYFTSDDDQDPAKFVRSELERKLISPRIRTTRPIVDIVQRLWQTVFRYAREGATVNRADLVIDFGFAGVDIVGHKWQRFPVLDKLHGRLADIEALTKLVGSSPAVLVHGISGSGKTTLVAEVAKHLSTERPACWVTVGTYTDFKAIYAETASTVQLDPPKDPADTDMMIERVATAVSYHHLLLVVDSTEKASSLLLSAIEALIRRISSTARKGSGAVVMLGTIAFNWIDILNAQKAATCPIFPVHELTIEAFREMLELGSVTITQEEMTEYHQKVQGHALSLAMMVNLCSLKRGDLLQDAIRKSYETAQTLLVAGVIEALPSELRTAWISLSVFDYPFELWALDELADECSPIAVRELARRGLVRYVDGTVAVHDAVRIVTEEFLAQRKRRSVHAAIAESYYRRICEIHAMLADVEYDTGIKWVNHVALSCGDWRPEENYAAFLDSDPSILGAIVAIDTRGYPYDFIDDSLDDSWSIVEQLMDEDIVEERPGSRSRFKLKNMGFCEIFFIHCLCLKRNIWGSTGYHPAMKYNYSYWLQNLYCPWEHCIEHQPLPKYTRSRHASWLEECRIRLSTQADLDEPTRLYLEQIISHGTPDDIVEDSEENDVLERASCFVFGHVCPGGEDQASLCRLCCRFTEVDLLPSSRLALEEDDHD